MELEAVPILSQQQTYKLSNRNVQENYAQSCIVLLLSKFRLVISRYLGIHLGFVIYHSKPP